ncbi:hypothetical protein NE237_000698 [Protea cynaroides]|uniref:aspartate carbamoyltransferase n=1 Tax=Protea cynaroides TaxID=273540 RepID=A0A9Q0KRP0_9MAGN|nr:hypothetical protein NE237_000698 [Protea cynaroides]
MKRLLHSQSSWQTTRADISALLQGLLAIVGFLNQLLIACLLPSGIYSTPSGIRSSGTIWVFFNVSEQYIFFSGAVEVGSSASTMSSSSFCPYTLHKGAVSFRVANISETKCHPRFLQSCSSLPYKPSAISNSMSSSVCMVPIHSWFFTEKRLQWGLTGRSLPSNGNRCKAVCIEKSCSFQVGEKFQLDDVIEAQQFDRGILNAIFEVAREMENVEKNSPGSQILKGYLMATLFYEPSTRTRLSFESAMKHLGGEVLTTENAREFSSAAKGETLEDTIRTVEGYSDIIVMRHFESGAARRAAATASIPVINAGDGPGQHPTQALLDVYTIGREIGKLDGIKVGLVGDLANGRTVRSLAYLLTKYQDVKIYFVAPDVVKMKDDIKDYLTSKGIEWEESADLMEVASKCDVVYQTRIQRERFGENIDLYEEARGKYIVDRDVLHIMQKHAVVMHPLPRLDEVDYIFDINLL